MQCFIQSLKTPLSNVMNAVIKSPKPSGYVRNVILRMPSFTMKIKLFVLFLSVGIFTSVQAQTSQIDKYLSQIEQGEYTEARKNISSLREEYPQHPGVLYLQGVLEPDGDKAHGLFMSIVENARESKYHDDAVIRVAEYLYAKGLYITAEKYLRLIPVQHPRSPHLERAANMLINSMEAAGKTDSSRIWQRVLSEQFPRITFDEGQEQQRLEGSEVSADDEEEYEQSTEVVEDSGKSNTGDNNNRRPFTLQVGAFSTLENAMQEKNNLESQGYSAQVLRRQRGDLELYLVWVGQYTSHDAAEAAGKKIQEQTDYSYFVVNTSE